MPDQDMSATDVVSVEVPDIGDFDDVPVIEILVSPGDTVETDDPLLTLESDKATMDVPAPFAGTIKDIQVDVGDRVSQGRVLLTMEQSGSAAGQSEASAAASDGAATEAQAPDAVESAVEAEEASAPEAESEPAPAAGPPIGAARRLSEESNGAVYASPSVRRLARERGIDLHQVHGSGRKGRITREDVEQFSSSPGGPAPARRGCAGRRRCGSGPGPEAARSTSRSSGPWSASSARGSSGSRRRTWRATG